MLSVEVLIYGSRHQSGDAEEDGRTYLRTGLSVQKGYFLSLVIDGDYHTEGVRPAILDIVTGKKMRN